MATALQKQLAAIAANSTHQLDLKAQKQRHAKSLLFEPRDAAAQSFDAVFQVCSEGFEELCMLDSRFTPFATNLFSEQSKEEDRTQMTATENEELDKTLKSFLGLVCGRLLLKPAMQAVEWLVRRFRVQEYNTEWTIMTFLPYHGSHMFPTLMSILPEELPPSFRFLHPYVASLQSPPRHAILSAAIGKQTFFSAFSQYVLTVARARHHSAVLLGFWASITAQAVNGMIDSSRSGRDSIRKQREEDLMLRILPVLQSAISIKGVQELYLGSCMIMTILGTKADLADGALDAMMEAVAGSWTDETMTEGLTCLALLADEKQHTSQPKRVTKALLKSPELLAKLDELSKNQRVGKLSLMTAVGIIDGPTQQITADNVATLSSILDADLLTDQQFVHILECLISRARNLKSSESSGESWKAVSGLLSSCAKPNGKPRLLSQASRNAKIPLRSLGLDDSAMLVEPEAEQEADDMEIDAPKDENPSEEFKKVLQNLPQLDNASFWVSAKEQTFNKYLQAFDAALPSKESLDRLLCQNYLCRSRAADHPTFLTFTARAWTSSMALATKLSALDFAINVVQEQEGIDFQALLPYTLHALADNSRRVRKLAAQLCVSISKAYGDNARNTLVWADKSAYGGLTVSLHWLPSEDAHTFVIHAIIPWLEDCVLDQAHAARLLSNVLNTDSVKQLKKSTRQSACSLFASHARITPVLGARLFMLRALSGVGKTATEARTKHLIPLIQGWAEFSETDAKTSCENASVDLSELDKATVGAISHRSQGELTVLQRLAFGQLGNRSTLSELAFRRMRHLWPSLTDAAQHIITGLLDKALADAGESDLDAKVQTCALDTLRSVNLPEKVLVHLVVTLPSASELQDQPSAAKKRRTSESQNHAVSRPIDQVKLQAAIRRITLVLELVESSTPDKHPRLVKGLFHLLGEIHHYKSLTGSELVYIQQLLLGCLNTIVMGIQQAGSTEADRSVIRTDLIVECVRTTSSPQVHNAALLLMSSLASWAPEMVLHSVMPLFTFMSSTLLRQHDEFSAHVTDQTVARIVPPLAASLKKKGKDLVTGAAELLLSFTAAFEHVPLHRRLGLFQHLIETLGADQTLFAVIAMLIERYANEGAVPSFVEELANHFDATTVLTASTQYLDLIFDALKPQRKLADVLLGFGDKDGESKKDSVEDLLEGLAALLASRTLRDRLALKPGKEQQVAFTRSTYAVLLEKTMQLTRDLTAESGLEEAANSVLASVLGLMPTEDFIDSSAQLMQTGSDETRQQVFRSLEARVVQARRGDKEAQRVFIDALPNCGVFIAQSQPIPTRHAAISCVDQICEKFGKTDTQAVSSVAEAVAGDAALGNEEPSVRIISILCIASMVEVLGEEAVGILPAVLTRTLEYMRKTLKEETPDEQLLSAGFSLLGSVLDHLPWMLSAKYLDDALALAARTNSMSEANIARVFLNLASTRVAAQELFTSVERMWDETLKEDADSTRGLLEVVAGSVGHHGKATVTKNASTLFAVLLKAFDLRRDLSQDTDVEDVDDLCALVDRLALDATLKLNDATFRPFFVRLTEWTSNLPKKDVQGRDLRLISLFSFTLALFEQLKSIVTSYASFVLDSAVKVLQRDGATELLDIALKTLTSSFQNDQDDFWQAPSHFDVVAEPLINQLLKAKITATTIQIIPTITELASASSSPEHLKDINKQLMQLMKHQDAAVRLAAVQCERDITEKLTFDWLALLPEMLPAISEAQEDDSEDVEREVLRWVKQIEDITGESLEGMLA